MPRPLRLYDQVTVDQLLQCLADIKQKCDYPSADRLDMARTIGSIRGLAEVYGTWLKPQEAQDHFLHDECLRRGIAVTLPPIELSDEEVAEFQSEVPYGASELAELGV